MANIEITHNTETYLLIDEADNSAAVEFVESKDGKYGDVFWVYDCSGLHTGNPFLIAVKNPRYEADGDEHGIYYYFTSDGYFWADDLTPLPDALDDWYSDALYDAAKMTAKSE